MTQAPGILVTGPRAAGKTTTVARRASSVVSLETPEVAAAFKADPDAALASQEAPVLIDEWQAVPEVIGAVRRAIDRDPAPGRFLLTGSARSELDSDLWPATGRLVRLPMYPMTVREKQGAAGRRTLLDRLANEGLPTFTGSTTDLTGYVELALEGGFPLPALQMEGRVRDDWFETYVEQLLTHDIGQIGGDRRARNPERMRRYLEAYALNSAGLADHRTLYEAAGISRDTAVGYEALLTALTIAIQVPAWRSNRLKRVALSAKRYLVDPSLIGAVLKLDLRSVMTDGDLLGRVLDTFVAAQLRAEAAVAENRPRLFHLRTRGGRHEVDLLAELRGGGVIGIEVKAGGVVSERDVRHLIWQRDELGDRYLAGLLLHTGQHTYELSDRIVAAPISVLWDQT